VHRCVEVLGLGIGQPLKAVVAELGKMAVPVSGDEAMVNIGNDVAFGLSGRIETLKGVLEFGDVETNDASWWIAPLINGTFGESVTSWLLAYDQADQRVFCFPNIGDEAWVLHKSLLFGPNRQVGGKNISPWARWTAKDDVGQSLRPTAIGNIFNPTDFPRQLESSPGSASGPALPTLFFAFDGGNPNFLQGIAPPNPVIITAKTGVCDIDATPQMTNFTVPSGEASASSTSAGAAWEVFNRNNSAQDWRSEDLNPQTWAIAGDTEYVQYQFAEALVINAYQVQGNESIFNPEALLSTWTLEAGYGGSVSVLLDSVLDGVGPAGMSKTTITGALTLYTNKNLGNNIPFDTFRITVSQPRTPSTAEFVAVSELHLYECMSDSFFDLAA